MPVIKNYSIADIVNRIVLVLPSKFSREENTLLHKIWQSIAEGLSINTNAIDELNLNTFLDTATGKYVDMYITDLSGIGRASYTPTGDIIESDSEYKDRFNKMMYVHNSTKGGIKNIVFDLNRADPYNMYLGSKRGLFANSRQYYNDGSYSTYGGASEIYTGYIEFTRKPNRFIIDFLCQQIASAQSSGIQIYLKYPLENDLIVELSDGTLERAVLI